MTSNYGATPWRRLLYKELKNIEVTGKTIDLGGSRKSGYHELFPHAQIEVANTDADYGFDIKLDLEKPFALSDATYNSMLCINTLEHIYAYEQVVVETKRILKSGGTAVFAVPFLVQLHPCPHDHWRFTKETLEKVFKDAGFTSVEVRTIARGPCTAGAQIMYNTLQFAFLRELVYWKASALDGLFSRLSKRYRNAGNDYALGFVVIAKS